MCLSSDFNASKLNQAFERSQQKDKKRNIAKFKLTGDQIYLFVAFEIDLPFLPVTTSVETTQKLRSPASRLIVLVDETKVIGLLKTLGKGRH